MFSIAFAVMVVSGDSQAIRESGFFQGYSTATWLVVLIQVCVGVMLVKDSEWVVEATNKDSVKCYCYDPFIDYFIQV